MPAAIRKALGVRAGDRLVFIVQGDQVQLVSARQLAMQVWANNTGGDGADSAADVRALRRADQQVSADALERIEVDITRADRRSDEEVIADVLETLGLPS